VKLVTERPDQVAAAERGASAAGSPLVGEYLAQLPGKAAGTLDAYQRVLRQFLGWLAERPGGVSGFAPEQLTAMAVETYLEHLGAHGYSVSHRARVKAALNGLRAG
jgi:site-specific recombinase XerD